jgi:DNA repair protein RAD50
MPPNTKGASFLFDPKLIDEIETKGRIKLYFKDMSGLNVQVQKNMSSTQKLKKVEFRTLETIISRYDAQNKLASTITSKCINADAEVINAIGVSKAVLEYVIFCHQEDSNWPLSDGKMLKTRFDEIFSATKYIKALDVLRKCRLEKSQLIKQLEIERKHLEGYKTRSDHLNRDLNEYTRKFEDLQTKKEECKEKMKPVQKQLDFFFQKSTRLLEVKAEMEKIGNEKQLLEKQIKELLQSTKDCLFQGSDIELREYIQKFDQTTNKMRREEEDANQERIAELNLKLKQLNQQKSKLTIECGAMENKYNMYLERKKNLNDLCAKICSMLGLDESDFKLSRTEIDSEKVKLKLDEMLDEQKANLKQLESETKSTDLQHQSKIDSEREQKSKLDQNIQNKREQVVKYRKQLQKIGDELKLIQNDRIQNELNSKCDEFEAHIGRESELLIDSKSIKDEISKLELERMELKREETDLDAKITRYHQNSKIRTEINMLKNYKQSKMDQVRKIKIHIEEDFEKFFEDSSKPTSSLKSLNDAKLKTLFDSECKDLIQKLQQHEEKRKDIDKRLCSNELKRKMFQDELRAKEAQLRACEDKLLQVNDMIVSESDIEKFERILESLQEEHVNLLDEKGYLNGVDKTYKRFLQQLETVCDEQSCPVCMRVFRDMNEISDTVSALQKYTKKLPQKILDIESKIKQAQTKLDQMLNAKSIKESYDKIKNTELATLKTQLDSYDRSILPKLRSELKENEEIMKKLEERKANSDQIQNEIVLIDKYSSECAEIDSKIERIAATSALNDDTDDDASLDLENLNTHKSQIKNELDTIGSSIEAKQEEINRNYARTDRINSLKEKLNELKTKKNELAMKCQKKTQLIEKQGELEHELTNSEHEIEELNAKLKQSMQNLNRLIQERQEKMSESQSKISQRSKFIEELRANLVKLSDLIEFKLNYEQNDDSNLTRLRKELKEIEIKERDFNGQIEQCRQKLDDIKTELARHDIKQRELNDNLKLREKRAEYEVKTKLYKEKKDELQFDDSNLDLKDFKNEQRKAEMKRDELQKEMSDIKTQMNNLQGRIDTIKSELELDNYQNALEKFLHCSSDLKVLELSIQDIEKYYKALDKAIMNYHALKMSEINKSIKQLWRQVYRGTDIDYIEIRSEEESPNEDGSIAATATKTRRSYNYRVVLIKGDTCLDMRGRCSAGQKVLASIIIRLALAETFCLNSGILALDEPTTNLDRENIESLASALVE